MTVVRLRSNQSLSWLIFSLENLTSSPLPVQGVCWIYRGTSATPWPTYARADLLVQVRAGFQRLGRMHEKSADSWNSQTVVYTLYFTVQLCVIRERFPLRQRRGDNLECPIDQHGGAGLTDEDETGLCNWDA